VQIQHVGPTPDQQQKFTHINSTHTQTCCMNRAIQHPMYKAKGEGCQSQLTNLVLTDSLHPLLCIFITTGCLSWTYSMNIFTFVLYSILILSKFIVHRWMHMWLS